VLKSGRDGSAASSARLSSIVRPPAPSSWISVGTTPTVPEAGGAPEAGTPPAATGPDAEAAQKYIECIQKADPTDTAALQACSSLVQ